MLGRFRDCCSLAYGFQQTKLAPQAASVLPAGAVDLMLEGGPYADNAKTFAMIGGAVPACRPELSRSQASKSVPWFVKQFLGLLGSSERYQPPWL
jgi:hypothetical protein